MANTTWNPADKNVGITLTGSNLIATNSNNALSGVRAIQGQNAGKFYWEVTFTVATWSGCAVGFTNATYVLNQAVTSASLGSPILGVPLNGQINGGLTGAGLGVITAGTTVCLAVDAGAGLAWFRSGAAGLWNASGSANPATGAGGYNILSLGLGGVTPLYPWCVTGNTNDKMTANFGDTAFVGGVPAGFTAGFPAGAVVGGGAQTVSVMVLA